MVKKHEYKNLVWVDLESPTSNEVRQVMEEYSVYPLIAEELLTPTFKPKVDLYTNCIYLILHFPALRHANSVDQRQEIDFIIGKHFLITTHYDTIDPLHKFSKVFEVNSILDKSEVGDHAGFIFYFMIKKLYQALIEELDSIRSSLDEAEEKIFNGEEKKMVRELSEINRELLDFKNSTNLHKEVLNSFEVAGRKFFGDDFTYYLRDILSEYYKIESAIQSSKEYLEELRKTNDSLLSAEQNETMKVFTVMAFVFLPLSFIASAFGMNTVNIPIVGSSYDWYIIMLMMALIGISIFTFFKYKKWL